MVGSKQAFPTDLKSLLASLIELHVLRISCSRFALCKLAPEFRKRDEALTNLSRAVASVQALLFRRKSSKPSHRVYSVCVLSFQLSTKLVQSSPRVEHSRAKPSEMLGPNALLCSRNSFLQASNSDCGSGASDDMSQARKVGYGSGDGDIGLMADDGKIQVDAGECNVRLESISGNLNCTHLIL